MTVPHQKLSRREREIMNAIFALGNRASAEDIRGRLTDPPGYSAVRAMLRILEEKGHVRHEQDGARYVFIPTLKRDAAKRSALRHLVNTFFDGSASQVMAALFDLSARDLDEEELRRLRALIEEAEKGRKP